MSTAATLAASPAVKVALPERAHGWQPMTVAWWDTIWRSPMTAEWVDADVPGLVLVADLVDRYWREGDPKLASEIRMQGREYGLTPLSRRSLSWVIKRDEQAAQRPQPATTRTRRQTRGLLGVLEGGRRSA